MFALFHHYHQSRYALVVLVICRMIRGFNDVEISTQCWHSKAPFLQIHSCRQHCIRDPRVLSIEADNDNGLPNVDVVHYVVANYL